MTARVKFSMRLGLGELGAVNLCRWLVFGMSLIGSWCFFWGIFIVCTELGAVNLCRWLVLDMSFEVFFIVENLSLLMDGDFTLMSVFFITRHTLDRVRVILGYVRHKMVCPGTESANLPHGAIPLELTKITTFNRWESNWLTTLRIPTLSLTVRTCWARACLNLNL